MHDLENEMRELLRERAGDIGLESQIPARVVRRSRRRRALTVGAAALGAAAGVLLVLAGLRSLPVPDGKSPATPAPSVQEAMPPTFVGSTQDDEIVLASTETGTVLSTIVGPDVVGPHVHGADMFTVELALTPDGTGVYLSTNDTGEGRRLMLAPIDGGELEDLGPGWDPVPSPDGARLAYVECTPDRCGRALVIRDLGTGAETRVPNGDSDLLGLPVAWLPDGRLVARLLEPGDSPGAILLIDPQRPPASLPDAPRVEPLVADVTTWRPVGYDAPTGGVLAAETCCGFLGERTRIVSVDPDSGEDLGTIVRGRWWAVVEPDRSGQHLLLTDGEGGVYIASDGEAPRRVADGFVDVDWSS